MYLSNKVSVVTSWWGEKRGPDAQPVENQCSIRTLNNQQPPHKTVPHQCCVAGERTKFYFFERWLESQNVQSLLLRYWWQAGDPKLKKHQGHVLKAACSHQNQSQFTFLHQECCTGSSSRRPEKRSHMRSCTAVCLCSTCSRTQILWEHVAAAQSILISITPATELITNVADPELSSAWFPRGRRAWRCPEGSCWVCLTTSSFWWGFSSHCLKHNRHDEAHNKRSSS